MKEFKTAFFVFLACCFFASLLPGAGWTQIPHPKTYIPTLSEIQKHKKPFDDPRPYRRSMVRKQVGPSQDAL